jgi:hypothetical protein
MTFCVVTKHHNLLYAVPYVHSDLGAIPANAFRGLSNLVEIELSHGRIQSLDAESFSGIRDILKILLDIVSGIFSREKFLKGIVS